MAERTKTYTAFDYADINDHLLNRWNIANIQVRVGVWRGWGAWVCVWMCGCVTRVTKVPKTV